MATVINTFTTFGIDGCRVLSETTTLNGPKMLSIIGLGDQAVRESGERIEAALDACGYSIPKKKVIISLAPGDIKKRGSHFDLAMALGILIQTGSITPINLDSCGFIGELSLNGTLRPCRGVLSMVAAAKEGGIRTIVLPIDNAEEASLISGITVCGVKSLFEVIDLVEGRKVPVHQSFKDNKPDNEIAQTLDFADVRGQDELVDAVVLAAAGGHNLLMTGSPGCGKTMIAQRIPTILPKMNEDEQLEVTKIHSIAGHLEKNSGLIKEHPFRAPHHNASLNSLIGGGANALPGEVSLAHNGVLFLDEVAEFPKHVLDALRQPIENKCVTVSRVNGVNTYPSNFMLVCAMNPCPCGYYPLDRCRCTDYEIMKYRGKLSGPLMDRIDIQKDVRAVDFFDLEENKGARTSAELRGKVKAARDIEEERYRDFPGINTNSQMTGSLIKRYCALKPDAMSLLRENCEKNSYSARVINKLLKLARTAADLRGSENIEVEDIFTVISCRDLDRSNNSMLVVK